MCKPESRDTAPYDSLLSCLQTIQKNTIEVPYDQTSRRKIKIGPRSVHKAPSSILQLLEVLEKEREFRWNSNEYNLDLTFPKVFWPVRLRKPTPIHAVQAFVAAGLQRLGAQIFLYFDDLGRVSYSADQFKSRLQRWFLKMGEDFSKVDIQLFSAVVTPEGSETQLHRTNPWKWMKTLFGDTDGKLGDILDVAKLLPTNELRFKEELLGRRPRRLLTPANVRACLEELFLGPHAASVITLGGDDENKMWRKLVEETNTAKRPIGNLYIPILKSSEAPQPLYMGETDDTLVWDERVKIANAFDEEAKLQGWDKEHRLIPWCVENCHFLPQLLLGEDISLHVGDAEIRDAKNLASLDQATLKKVWTDSVHKALNQ